MDRKHASSNVTYLEYRRLKEYRQEETAALTKKFLEERKAFERIDMSLWDIEERYGVDPDEIPHGVDLVEHTAGIICQHVEGLEKALSVLGSTLPQRVRAKRIQEEINALWNDHEDLISLGSQLEEEQAILWRTEESLYIAAGEEAFRKILLDAMGEFMEDEVEEVLIAARLRALEWLQGKPPSENTTESALAEKESSDHKEAG